MVKWLLVQTAPGLDLHANVEQIEALVGDGQGCDIIVLPELALCWGELKEVAELARAVSLEAEVFYRALAARTGACVLGSFPGPAEDGKFINKVMAFAPQGRVLADYEKIHLFDVDLRDGETVNQESAYVQAGRSVETFDYRGVRVGLAICFDLRFPALFQQLRADRAVAVAVPSAFSLATGRAHWETLLKARAIETQSYVLAANQCGQAPGAFPTYGHSMAVDPWGTVIARLGAEPGAVVVETDIDHVDAVRRKMPLAADMPGESV